MTVESWALAAGTTMNSVSAPASNLANFLPGLTDIAYQDTPHAGHLQPREAWRSRQSCTFFRVKLTILCYASERVAREAFPRRGRSRTLRVFIKLKEIDAPPSVYFTL